MHTLGLWEEIGENPCKHEQNMENPHTKAPGWWICTWTFLEFDVTKRLKRWFKKTVIVRLSDLLKCQADHLEAAFSNMAFNGLQCTDAPPEGRWHCWVVLFFQESVDHVNVVVLKTFIQYDTNCLMGLRNYCTQINISPFDNKSFFVCC